jgi:cell division protein FtsW (lipid II flippase)
MRIEEYLDTVCAKIKWKEARKPIRAEMEGHIAQRVEEYLANGDSPAQAEEKAVCNMGDAVQTGLTLNKLHRPRVDWILIGALALLLGLGVLYTITYNFYEGKPDWLLSTVGGIAACLICSFIDLHKLFAKKLSYILLYFACAAMIGFTKISYASWSYYFSFSTVLPTIGLIGMILAAGLWIKNINSTKSLIWFLLIILIGEIVLMAKPVFTLAINLLICILVMLWMVNLDKKRLIFLTLASIVALMLITNSYLFEPYRLKRLIGSFDTTSNSSGFYLHFTRTVVSNLNWFDAAKAIPTTLGALAMDGESSLLGFMRQYGIAAGLCVVSLCGVVIWRIYKMLLKIKDRMGRTVSVGLCTYITMQIVWNVLMSFGVVPNLFSTFIPMFAQVWSQSLIFSSLLGILMGLYKKSDLYRTEDKPDKAIQSSTNVLN